MESDIMLLKYLSVLVENSKGPRINVMMKCVVGFAVPYSHSKYL